MGINKETIQQVMISKLHIFLLFLLLAGCSSDSSKMSEPVLAVNEETITRDTGEVKLKPGGIELFIDSMKNANYLLDTNRLKQVTWSFLDKFPKSMDKGNAIIRVPFPVERYQQHFGNPKTYFFASWNNKEKTFKNGNDYLLMTWTIDSAGMKKEKEIYSSLHEFMGNFPCYIFRSNDTVHAMCHRMTVEATETRKLAQQLRNYVDIASIIYSP